jgi:prostaglandin-E synthase 1
MSMNRVSERRLHEQRPKPENPMSATLQNPVTQAYLASALVLSVNLLVLASATAVTRTQADEVVNPEDKKLNEKATVVYEEGNGRTGRWKRAHRNALENIPLFLLTGFLLTLTPISVTFATALFGFYALMRLAHSFFYVNGVQPFRTASFGMGVVTQLVILGYLGYAAFA